MNLGPLSDLIDELIKRMIPKAGAALLDLGERWLENKIAETDTDNRSRWMDMLRQHAAVTCQEMYSEFSEGIKKDLSDGKLTKDEATARLKEVGETARQKLEMFIADAPEQLYPLLVAEIPGLIDLTYKSLQRQGILATQHEFFARAMAARNDK